MLFVKAGKIDPGSHLEPITGSYLDHLSNDVNHITPLNFFYLLTAPDDTFFPSVRFISIVELAPALLQYRCADCVERCFVRLLSLALKGEWDLLAAVVRVYSTAIKKVKPHRRWCACNGCTVSRRILHGKQPKALLSLVYLKMPVTQQPRNWSLAAIALHHQTDYDRFKAIYDRIPDRSHVISHALWICDKMG